MLETYADDSVEEGMLSSCDYTDDSPTPITSSHFESLT